MDATLAKKISKAARAARQALELSQTDVAERLELSTEFYGRLERGAALPSVPTLVRLVAVLGVGADTLLKGAVSPGVQPSHPRSEGSREERLALRRLKRASPSAVKLVNLLLLEFERAEKRSGKTKRRAR